MMKWASLALGCFVWMLVGGIYAHAESISVLIADASAEAPATTETTSAATVSEVMEVEYIPTACPKPCQRRTQFGGWLQTGVYGNEHGSPNGIENGYPLGNVSQTGWHVQQLWLYAERKVDTGGYGVDWGFRADAMFGNNAGMVQSWSDGSFDGDWNDSLTGDGYGYAIPRLYFALGFNRWTLKLGKFDAIMGYESQEGPKNFFYSHSYFFNHEPVTHTGALLHFAANDYLSFNLGLTTGADTGFGNEYGDFGILAGVNLQVTEKVALGYTVMWNNAHDLEKREGTGGSWDWPGWNNRNYFQNYSGLEGEEMLHTFVMTWNITDRLTYVGQINYGSATGNDIPKLGDVKAYEQFGFASYLLYTLTERLSLGVRMEWFRQNDLVGGSRITTTDAPLPQNPSATHQNCYEITVAANYKLTNWLTIRPEMRYDAIFGNYDAPMFGNEGRDNKQLSGGVALIAEF